MTAKEIRELSSQYRDPNGSVRLTVAIETAAQLAELNENIKALIPRRKPSIYDDPPINTMHKKLDFDHVKR